MLQCLGRCPAARWLFRQILFLGSLASSALGVAGVRQLLSAAQETWRRQALGDVHWLAQSTCCFYTWLIKPALFDLLALSLLILHVHWSAKFSAGATVSIDQSRLATDARPAELLDAEALEAEQSPSFER